MASFPQAVPTSVYRYYDEHGVLLYVGITSRGIARNIEHNTSKAWWPFVGTQSVDHYETRPEALRRESELIREFRPPFNTQQNPGYMHTRQAYLLFRDSCGGVAVSMAKRRLLFLPHSRDEDGSNTVLRSAVAVGNIGALSVDPGTRAVTDRRKYRPLSRAWQLGPFVLVSIGGKLPPIVSASSRIKLVNKPAGIVVASLLMVPEYHEPSSVHNKPHSRRPAGRR